MSPHLRIARPVLDLSRAVAQYQQGLGLEELARFADHDGFDGTVLGFRGADFHFEFTVCRTHPVTPSPTPEDLWVFYIPDPQACTFEDADGYRVVIQRAAHPAPRSSAES